MENSELIIYTAHDGGTSIVLLAKDANVWMNQNQIAEIFYTSKQNIGHHVSKVLVDNELMKYLVVKNYFTTAADGKEYKVAHYALDMTEIHLEKTFY